MAEGKDDEIERLRRLFAADNNKCKEPSHFQKIVTWLRSHKVENSAKQEKKTDDAA